ncbi:glycoside hydrolase family 32 protein [Paenibacillus sp. LHD-38]|uniref:glycoside hydrolase family 32 protein n=1 Tax=Paenibacillus sp. LHD-38 TaxID=3072143 RepID=UPI00280E1C7F|nr:glycoside hydrolase family 32 protein [Paenibacillus sp. LHD-38]MDQ8733669.1 glycoside hydrolase family 32 protein [Paenibacillus sp. LHD-38]
MVLPHNGEYHLFAQDGGKWTHSVSTDLTHWKRLPIALPWQGTIHSWSGSAIVDANNASGLFNGGSGLLAYYTMYDTAKSNVVGYKRATSKLFVNRTDAGADLPGSFTTLQEETLNTAANRIKLRIFVDASSVEAFGNDGKVVFSNTIFPNAASTGMSFYATGGNVKIVTLKLYPLVNTWR